MKLKILFLINSLGGGGAERVLVNLVNNMDQSRYDITIQTLFPAGINKDRLKPEVHLTEGRISSFKGISRVFKFLPASILYRYFIKKKYDVIIAYMHGIPTKILQCAPKNIGKIAWLHTFMQHSSLPTVFLKYQIVPAFNKFDKIVGVAKEVSKSFIDMYGLSEKVITCYNTNDVPAIKELSEEAYSFLNWTDFHDGFRLVTVGRLGAEKGYDRLLTVCARLRDNGILFKLLIIGDGILKQSLIQQCKELKLENSVIFTGYQKNPFPYVKRADLFIVSSRQEGLNTAMSEALILGTPVLSTRVSGAAEVLGENSEYGLLVENDEEALYQGMNKLLKGYALLEHYREKAKERAVFFDTQTTVKAVEDLIDEVVQCRN